MSPPESTGTRYRSPPVDSLRSSFEIYRVHRSLPVYQSTQQSTSLPSPPSLPGVYRVDGGLFTPQFFGLQDGMRKSGMVCKYEVFSAQQAPSCGLM